MRLLCITCEINRHPRVVKQVGNYVHTQNRQNTHRLP